jgi:hypothetical protein
MGPPFGAPRPPGRACLEFSGSGAWALGVAPHGILSADLLTLRTRKGEVVALDTGQVKAILSGDFPPGLDAIEYAIDAATSVVVAPAHNGSVCAGVLRRTPVPDPSRPPTDVRPPGERFGRPRCVPASPPVR